MRKIRFFKWLVTLQPVTEEDVPTKWQVGTHYSILGIDFILWEL